MEKEQLIKFIAAVMDDSGFNVTKNYRVANQTIDIYGTLSTNVGEVGVVVACKNYEEPWKVGLDVIKDMEKAARNLRASKIIIFTTSSYTHGCALYAQKRNIKLVDRKGLIKIAKNYAQKRTVVSEPTVDYDDDGYYDDTYTPPSRPARLDSHSSSSSHAFDSARSRMLSLNRGGGSRSKSSRRSSGSGFSFNRPSVNTSDVRNAASSVDLSGTFEFFKEHMIVYMILLIVIASAVSYIFSMITSGPYTGLGRICTSAIVCFGGLALVNRNVSDLIFKGGIIFFISIIISIVTLTM